MERKMLFFDIDGTLAVGEPGRQYIPMSAQYTLRQLVKNGHFISIATGRSYAMAEETMITLGFHNMVSDGGYGVTINDELLGIEPLDYENCIALIDECNEKGFAWGFSPDNETRRLTPDDRFYDLTHDIYMDTVVKEGLNPRDYDEIFKVYVACRKGEEEQLESLKNLPWNRYHDTYIFIEPADKSRGIKKIVQYLKGDLKDVYVFGDDLNDLTMFIDDWTSIAVGNAKDELKKKASYVTSASKDNGIYHACVHYGLIDPIDYELKVYDLMHKDVKDIREHVFMDEQGFTIEFDAIDIYASYVVAYEFDVPVGTLRFFKQDDRYYIGRVCVEKAFRGRNIGSLLMKKAEEELKGKTDKVYLEAQVRAAHFYETLGYVKTNETHDDEGVPHVLMVKEL